MVCRAMRGFVESLESLENVCIIARQERRNHSCKGWKLRKSMPEIVL